MDGASRLLKQAAKDYAPGLPSKNRFLAIPKVKGQEWTFSVQQHDANRAGRHLDLRLTDNKGRAHSWAMRGELPAPGQKTKVIMQPTHRGDYATWEGTIPEGYGAGKVALRSTGQVDVLEAGPSKVTFVIPESRTPSEYSLIHMDGKDWLLTNHSTVQGKYPISHHKPKYREVAFEDAPVDTPDIMSAKIDGAHAEAILRPGKRPRLFSYRESKRGVPLEYTFKMPLEFISKVVPKNVPPMLVRGEVFGVDRRGRAIPENELGRLLNSTVDKARARMKEDKVSMRFAPFQIAQLRGRAFEAPYEEHLPLLKRLERALPATKQPKIARTPKEKRSLLKSIASGKLKETSEGVVLWGEKGPTKAKIRPDFDVYVREVYQEGGKRKGLAAGFRYSLTPNGPVVGQVGSGFNHTLKKYMLEHPGRVKGLVARVRAQHQFSSGALRAPSFKGWHHEKSGPRSAEVPG